MFRGCFWVALAILGLSVLAIACGSGDATDSRPSVVEAKEAGWQREVEPCQNAESFPELYEGVAMEEIGGGDCAFYYSPEVLEREVDCDKYPFLVACLQN